MLFRMPIKPIPFFVSGLLLLLASMSFVAGAADMRGVAPLPPAETFGPEDEPDDISIGSYVITTPYGYNKPENSNRRYPIVVLHVIRKYFGGDDLFRKYPAFYVNFSGSGSIFSTLIDDAISKGLRIDTNRILGSGFSNGGNSIYGLANEVAPEGKPFAAVGRVAGTRTTKLIEEIRNITQVWYNIGQGDPIAGIPNAKAHYEDLKNHPVNDGAEEIYNTTIVPADNKERLNWIVVKDGIEVVRYTEGVGMSHTPGVAYSNPEFFEWFFTRCIKSGTSPSIIMMTY